ncbi:hypothetical protein KMZ93_25645 [Bradyrhizobium sediminis]|uniref:Uncharacterized protein n=1 Tax=Bradyrhizobium sediminis TaxID=2840469 RepID=A0A975NXL8_9BRAD|nr:hypothetical protein [Bradyrhizobium sediminis]QWG23273.1 hypothetical protein KMZ93_25645 [Bradyrhizobium sediminis]
MTELLVIGAGRSLSVRPLPITFFRPISIHRQAQTEQAMRGVVFAGERELEPMQFPDPAPHAHDVVIEMEASGLCGGDLYQYRRWPPFRGARRAREPGISRQ